MRYSSLCVAMMLLASPAQADTKVLRFTQSTSLPVAWQQLPDRIATSIAAVIDGSPSEESLVTLQCDAEDACLEAVAEKLGVTELVFGTIRSGDDKQTKLVTIHRFVVGGKRASRTFTIVLVEQSAPHMLAREAQRFLEAPLRREPVAHSEDVDRSDDEPRVQPADDEPRIELGEEDPPRRGISHTTYALLIGGGAAVALGAGFTVQAWSVRSALARAPADTSQDIRRLQMLEQRGQLYTTVGGGLVIAGVATIGYGIYRAVRERRRVDTAVSVVPTHDGAAIVFAGSWR
jgi:hypothetical protein